MVDRIVNILALLVLCGAALCWGYGTLWVRRTAPVYREYSQDIGGKEAVLHDQGSRSIGFYAHDGRCGIVIYTAMVRGLASDESVAKRPVVPEWGWSGTGVMANYLGGIPDDLVPAWMTWHVPLVFYVCRYNDAAMRHEAEANAYLVDCWFLMLAGAVPLAVSGYGWVRRRRSGRGFPPIIRQ